MRIIIGALAALMLSGAAQAATFAYTRVFETDFIDTRSDPTDPMYLSAQLHTSQTVPNFDPSLGFLNSVTVTGHTLVSYAVQWDASEVTDDTFRQTGFSFQPREGWIDPYSLEILPTGAQIDWLYKITAGDVGSFAETVDLGTASYSIYDRHQLDDLIYYGADQATVWYDLNTAFQECLGYGAPITTCGSYHLQIHATRDVTVSYDYSPAAVPEPEAWIIMLLGFGACGMAVRRANARRPRTGKAT